MTSQKLRRNVDGVSKAQHRQIVLLNPNSGSVRDGNEIRQLIHESLPDAEIVVSRRPGDLGKAAMEEQANGCGTVIAAGGDGTLNEVLNGCLKVGGDTQLGLIPLGTGNDFARAIGLPTEISEAINVINGGHSKAVDVIRVTGGETRFLINVAAGGFAGLVSESLTPELKASWGPLSYLRGMIEALGEMEPYDAIFRIDGGAPQELSILNVVVANGSHVARGIPIAPAADPSDGLMDIVILKNVALTSLAAVTPQILAGIHLDNEEILHVRARHFSIRSSPEMTFNSDGEVIGSSPFEFAVLPQSVKIFAPS